MENGAPLAVVDARCGGPRREEEGVASASRTDTNIRTTTNIRTDTNIRGTMGTKTSTGTHVLILAGLIMLSYKELNPVLRVCLLFGSEETAWCGHLCVCLLIWAVLQDYKNCLFHAGRTFLNSLLSIFVSSVDVIGIENLPVHGPVILVANHFNQFADGLTVMCACQQRRISFLFARKSYDSLVVGFFARAMEQVPVTRPQDLAFTGSGTLLHLKPDDSAPHLPAAITTSGEGPTVLAGSSHRLVGSDKCKFTTELSEGDKIVFNACGGGGGGGGKHAKKEKATWKVISIESDCACLVSPVVAPTASKSTDTAGPAATKKPAAPSSPQAASPHSPPQKAPNWVTLTTLPADGKYKVLPRGDFGNMLKDVGKALQGGACIGVFPEGGSHDRTDLNELKPGVALMALGAQVPVHIVPVGLSYFRGHQFRSAKVTVHVGPPIMASEREQAEYDAGPGEGRQSACASLLKRIETAMRDVIVPASSFEELQVIHVARRLWYGPDKHKLPPAVRQDLDRRFAFGIKRLVETAPLSEKAFPTVAVDGKRFPAVGGDGTVGSPRPLIVPGLAAAMYPGAAYPEGRDAERRDAELTELVRRLRAYDKELRRLGLRDSQVPTYSTRTHNMTRMA